ncbi:MAG: S8 family serine peptidase, partial [Treponema sp.]|nr:S8 family serine peptidase [Treponema sp.]
KKRTPLVLLVLLLPLVIITVQCRFDALESGVRKQTNRSVEFGFDEGKIYSNATLQDSFAEDRVLIVLKKSASMDFRTYTPEDFPELNGVQVRDLSKRTMTVVQEQLQAQKTGDWSRLTKRIAHGMLVDVNKFRQILCLDLPIQSKENVLQTIKLLEQRDDIMYVGPDTMIEYCALPNSPPVHYEYYQEDIYNSISLLAAWNYISNNAITTNPIKVGVIDSGVYKDHEALIGRIDENLSYDLSPPGISLGGGPYNDQRNHGTLVAGVISANGTGLIGVAGAYPDISLVSLRVEFGYNFTLFISLTIDAVDYANNVNDNGNCDEFIDILNFSGGSSTFNFSLYTAINQYAGLFVCAAHNHGEDNDDTPIFPANWTTDFDFRKFSHIFPNSQYMPYLPRLLNLISVGAYTIDKTTTPYVERRSINQDPGWDGMSGSNYGANSVDLFAPTVFWSTDKNGGYDTFRGTSSATPIVTGVAALVKSMHPGLTGPELKDILLASVEEVPNLKVNNYCRTGGKINAENAVTQTPPIGSMEIIFAGIGLGNVGKFFLHPDGTWEIVEKGIYASPISSFAHNPENVHLSPVPSEITTYMIQNNIDDISDYFYLWVPVTGTPDAIYYKHEFYFTITSTGAYYCNYTGNTIVEEVFLPSKKRMIKVAYTSGQTVPQIPNIGSIDISISSTSSTYGSTTPGRIGKFYLLPNNTWEIVEKGVFSYPINYNPTIHSGFMNWNPVPAGILHYMDNEGIASITGHFNWLVPTSSPPPGTYDYYSHAFSFTIDSTGVQLQHIGSDTIESLLPTDKRRVYIENTSGSIY